LIFNNKVVISLGDPSGVGPEVFIKSLNDEVIRSNLNNILVISDPKILEDLIKRIPINLALNRANDLKSLKSNCLNFNYVDACKPNNLGLPNKNNSEYILNCIDAAISLCKQHKSNLVTGPINKEFLAEISPGFRGHTEHLKLKTNTKNVLMVLRNIKFTVGLVTTHLPLKDVSRCLTQEVLKESIETFTKGLTQYFGITDPKIGIMGLNPHCGESGRFGNEEKEVIKPVIQQFQEKGLRVEGPFSADTVFLKDGYDGLLSMYHDQALPVIKTIDFFGTVNITFGLPFMRTSVDHGTAYDIAEKLIANPSSMIEAIKLAGYGKKI